MPEVKKAETTVTSEIISSYKSTKKQFIGYNKATPSWSYCSGYTIGANSTVSFSGTVTTKWGAVQLSGSFGQNVQIHFDANQKKESRLAVKSKIKVNNRK